MELFLNECRICMWCIVYGFILSLIYHIIIFIRSKFKNHPVLNTIFDVLVGITAGIGLFWMILINNNGNIRGFYIVALFIGIFIYIKIFYKIILQLLKKT